MEKIYLIQGSHDFLIKSKINELIEQSKIDQFSIFKEYASDISIEDLMQELLTISFFADQKLIIIEGIDAFDRYTPDQIKDLLKYLANPSDDKILICTHQTALKKSKKSDSDALGIPLIIQELEKHAYLVMLEGFKTSDYPVFVKKHFDEDGYDIEDKSVNLIASNTNDLFTLYHEIQKIKTYFIETKEVLHADLDRILSDNYDNHLYLVTQALLANDIKNAYRVFEQLMKTQSTPVNIIADLTNRLLKILQGKHLLMNGYTESELAKYFKMESNQTYYLYVDIQKHSISKIEAMISSLEVLDYQIKSGQINDKLGFELFMLGVRK